MEHYIKVEKSKPECSRKELQPFEVEVKSELKFFQLLRTALKLLKEHGKVVFIGEASEVQRSVNLAEKLKSMHKDVSEHIDISHVQHKDLWIPKSPELGLENLEVTRHVPTISISITRVKKEHKTNDDDFKQESIHPDDKKRSPSKPTLKNNSPRQNGARSKSAQLRQKQDRHVSQGPSIPNPETTPQNSTKKRNANSYSKHENKSLPDLSNPHNEKQHQSKPCTNDTSNSTNSPHCANKGSGRTNRYTRSTRRKSCSQEEQNSSCETNEKPGQSTDVT